MAEAAQDNVEKDQMLLVRDVEIRRQLRSVIDLLESGLSELVKITAELRSLIRTIDDVTKQVESQFGIDQGKECFDRTRRLDCWCRTRDINQNMPTPLSEVHWQTYASQDWFSGFKHFPRLKDARDSIANFTNACDSHIPCKYYDQIAEVLLQIGNILNSLETSHSSKEDQAIDGSNSDASSSEFSPANSNPTPSQPRRWTQNRSESDTSRNKSPISSEFSYDISQNSYLSVLVDVNGDYEETLDYLLETLPGTDVEDDEDTNDGDKKDEPSEEPPPVPVLKVYLRKYIDETNNNSAMNNLQTYFD